MQLALPHDTDAHGFVFHSFQNPFDHNCHILWQFGVAWAAHGSNVVGLSTAEWQQTAPPAEQPAQFRFASEQATRLALLSLSAVPPHLMAQLFSAYLRTMAEYGWHGEYLSVARTAFSPPPIFQPQINAMIDCGYAVRTNDAVRWNSSVAPMMIAARLWADETGPSEIVEVSMPQISN